MKRMISWVRKQYRHLICGAFLAGSLALTFTRYWIHVARIGIAAVDLGRSVALYVCFLFHFEANIPVSVLQIQNIRVAKYLPFDPDELIRKMKALPDAFFDLENFSEYSVVFLRCLSDFLNLLILMIPVALLFWYLIKSWISEPNTDHGKDSRPLTVYKRSVLRWFCAVRDWCMEFYAFLLDHSVWWILAALVWAVNLNLVGIALEFLAYYFYFASSFDFAGIFTSQVYKLVIDLILMFSSLPFPVWCVIGYVVFDLIRKAIGFRILQVHEARNREFLESLPLVLYINGTMGSKKTTSLTDMALSFEILFRDKALELLLSVDVMFPNFPWILLEKDLVNAMSRHRIFNLASTRKEIRRWEKQFRKDPCPERIWGYEIDREAMEYNNSLEVIDIWQAIEDYSCLYFLYVIQSSLLISNYSVRVDNVMNHAGNFPLWDTDLFRRDPRMMDAVSRHAHILDFDVLRVSRQVVENNRNTGSFEFGVVLITEIDKERGNQLKLQGVRKQDFETNQKNDNFNYSFKMGRHPATVMNFPFIRFLTDAQRTEAWEADGRQLTAEVYIRQCSGIRIAMPFFTFYEMFFEWVFGKFSEIYPQYRYDCGDNKLSVRLLHRAAAAIIGRYNRIRNQFGFMEAEIEIRAGDHEENVTTQTYYLSTKKIYSRRFSTDCYRAFFAERSLKSKRGIDDYPEYKNTCAALDELHRQNSYFISEMEGLNDEEESDRLL